MAETREDRRAKLTAELAALDIEDTEASIQRGVEETSFADVLTHLVNNSAGYPTAAEREVHLRVVDRQLGGQPQAPPQTAAKASGRA
jgi:trehalose/maltose hydrolase-like predicted phosphorylase